ncbi:MAG: AraC family transcriptional regulator [Lachnospiraceae bacterium]|nr:AraC family transcriptional regulator [Lachnospiraceae bacterium]
MTKQTTTAWEQMMEPSTVEERTVCKLALGEHSNVYMIQLWEGIYLWANAIHRARLSDQPNAFAKYDCLLLNICHKGRCEVELAQGNYVYMSPGILNVSAMAPRPEYYYPGGVYEGIELVCDMNVLKENLPKAFADLGVTSQDLMKLKRQGNLLARVSTAALQEEEKLFEILCRIGSGEKTHPRIVYDLRLAIISLIYHLMHGEATILHDETAVTKGQRKIVTDAEAELTADLGCRVTVEQVAEHFGVSVSAFKKYFVSVYGRPVSQYMKEKRIEKAKELLIESSESIGTISLLCGYEHQGKFGAVFKAATGSSPLEYRRLHRVPGKSVRRKDTNETG